MGDERNILVTGASGLLGRSLVARLESEGTVSAVGYSRAAGLRSVDLRDSEALRELLDEVRPEVVVHGAAYRDPDFCEDHPAEAFNLNVAPVRRLCELLPDAAPLVFISSDYVFDGGAPPYREGDERRPVNEYGRLKAAAEDFVLQREAGLVLRVPLLIGAGPAGDPAGFIAKTLAQIRDPAPSSLDDVGIRFPTWTDDVAEAVAHLLRIGAAGVYHYSALEGGTKYEWALELADMIGVSMEHIAPDREGASARAARPGNTQLAVDKIRRSGLDRFTPFREVVRRIEARPS